MACNGYNHPPDCNCGWGGVFYKTEAMALKWPLSPGSFINPNAHCPECGKQVFFYRSPEGGRVFFESLGPPWPKHPCIRKKIFITPPSSAYWEAYDLFLKFLKKLPFSTTQKLIASNTSYCKWIEETLLREIKNKNFRRVLMWWILNLPPAALGRANMNLHHVNFESTVEYAHKITQWFDKKAAKGPYEKSALNLAHAVISANNEREKYLKFRHEKDSKLKTTKSTKLTI